MTHFMKLSPSAFKAFVEGAKRVEMRLCDEKRRTVRSGDCIIFDCLWHGKLQTRVAAVRHFEDFKHLYAAYSPADLGYADGETARAEDMLKYYSAEDEKKYGVVAIEIADIKEVFNGL